MRSPSTKHAWCSSGEGSAWAAVAVEAEAAEAAAGEEAEEAKAVPSRSST